MVLPIKSCHMHIFRFYDFILKSHLFVYILIQQPKLYHIYLIIKMRIFGSIESSCLDFIYWHLYLKICISSYIYIYIYIYIQQSSISTLCYLNIFFPSTYPWNEANLLMNNKVGEVEISHLKESWLDLVLLIALLTTVGQVLLPLSMWLRHVIPKTSACGHLTPNKKGLTFTIVQARF